MANLKAKNKNKCQIGAQIVVCEENINEITLATGNVKNTGIDYFQIKPVIFHPQDGRPQLSIDFWNYAMEISEDAKDKHETDQFDVFIKTDQFDGVRKDGLDRDAYPHCLDTFSPIIEADGKVYHCSQTRGIGKNEMGNLNEQSFKEIWESDLRKKMFMGINVKDCQPLCRCHPNNKILYQLSEEGITQSLKENLDAIIKNGGCGSNFI